MQQQQHSNQTHKLISQSLPIQSAVNSKNNKRYYFTELALISSILQQKLYTLLSSFNIDVSSIHFSQEEDVCQLQIKCCWVESIKEQEKLFKHEIMGNNRQKGNNHQNGIFIVLKVYITVLQIQTSIKFHVNYVKNQYEALPKLKMSQKQNNYLSKESSSKDQKLINMNYEAVLSQKLPLKQSYSYIDEFWLNYTNYLPKKIYQTYHMEDLQAKNNIQKFKKLLYIFQERIARQIVIQAGHYDYNDSNNNKNDNIKGNLQQKVVKVKDLWTTILSNNYDKINRYLTPKDYKNLSICNRQIYRILHTQKNYKVIFERKWGRTGFQLEQQNWIKLYKNKVLEQEKINRSKPVLIRAFYY